MVVAALPVSPPRASAQLVARVGVCTALTGAAVIHGTVVSEHYAQWRLAGLFFLGTQLVEVFLVLAAVYFWGRTTAQLIVVTSVGTVAVWLLSRTLGMPFGPAAFRVPEAVGVPDIACCLLELAAAALAARWAFTRAGATLPARPAGMAGRLTAGL